MKKWTQDEAIAFECARECITDMMGICSAAIAEAEALPVPDQARIVSLEAELVRLGRERADLSVSNHAEVARIRAEYGAKIRAHRARLHQQAA